MRKPGAGTDCFQFREVVKELVRWKGTEGASDYRAGQNWRLDLGDWVTPSCCHPSSEVICYKGHRDRLSPGFLFCVMRPTFPGLTLVPGKIMCNLGFLFWDSSSAQGFVEHFRARGLSCMLDMRQSVCSHLCHRLLSSAGANVLPGSLKSDRFSSPPFFSNVLALQPRW